MSFPDSKAKTLLRTLTIFGPLLASVLDWSPVALAAPASPSEGARESGSEKVGKGAGGETEGLGKRERKALKREKQREAMLKRIE
ncbi:MAG TPA: hypothetical protein VFD27_10000, partial [Chthoniobacteraceae bacterium]|nr:hypothetical protein [Chthoniobacteraceae bacterium]